MTERIYYKNPGLLEFTGTITESTKTDNGFVTVLDKTAFYPTSGGQMHDLGVLNSISITDVFEKDDTIYHVTLDKVGDSGETVSGLVDKDRRFWHRQLHSAQHILSQALYNLYSLETKSVHLGAEYGNIEVNTDSLSDEQLCALENKSNQMIAENHPVEILFIDSQEISNYPFRRHPQREGTIRVIKIGKLEYSACGGTHVNTTAEVQLIKIISKEKIRGRMAVNFICGSKAIQDYQLRFNASSLISKQLSCSVQDLPTNFLKLDTDYKNLCKQMSKIQREQLPIKAAELAENPAIVSNTNLVIKMIEQFDSKLIGKLSILTAENVSGLAILICGNKVAIASNLDSVDASHLARFISVALSFKGGGNKNSAQLGSTKTIAIEPVKEKVIEYLKNEK